MENCRQRCTPFDAGYQVIKDDSKTKVNPTAYQSLIGALIYLAVTTRYYAFNCKASSMLC